MNKTDIEWVRNPDGTTQGYTLNDKTGCLNHTPEGLCLGGMFPCYAFKLAHGRLKERYLANENILFSNYIIRRTPWANMTARQTMADSFHPRFWPERLEEPYKVKKPAGIFLDDMSDWMGDYWPEEWTRQELQMMKDNPQHRIYTLTKQPRNLIKFSPFPENCWVGVTATNRQMLLEVRKIFDSSICSSGIKARIKYIFFEPLLESVICDHKWEAATHQPAFSRRRIMPTTRCVRCGQDKRWGSNSELIGSDGKPIVDWVIIGAMTCGAGDILHRGHKYPKLTQLEAMPYGKKWTLQPKIGWVQEIMGACIKAGVKVFLKNNLLPMFQAEWAKEYDKEIWEGEQLRQEMPNV